MSRQEKDNTLKISGKTFVFKESDIKLFRNLENAINNLGRTFQKSGKIPDSERKTVLNDMTERYLSVMIVLHDILSSTLDVKNHSVRRVTDVSRAAEQNLLTVFVTAGAAARTQPWLAWEIMIQHDCLVLCHTRLQKRLNGATISALKKAVRTLEERRKGVEDLGDYLVEIVIPAMQVRANTHILLDESDNLQLEEHQISQLHKMLERVKILLEWKRQS